MASLDATSLFTNVCINKALQIVEKHWDILEPHTSLSQSAYLESLSLCCNSGFLTFRDHFFHQISGLAMGNNLAPDIANITLNDLIDTILPLFPHDIIFIKKYVDDLILILNPEKIPQILESFNSYHPRLKFTIECESDGRLPYLDILLIRQPDGHIQTDWYTKPTYSGRLLHFHSAHPRHQIINVARNLIQRSFSLSDPSFHRITSERVTKILSLNGFPAHLITNLISKFSSPDRVPPSTLPPPTPTSLYRSLPYIPLLTEKIKKYLKSNLQNLHLGLQTNNKLRHFYTPLKDPIPISQQSNVVYQIPCSDNNCSASYIGQTKNYLNKRLKQHEYSIKIRDMNSSALSQHAISTNHPPAFNEATILASEPFLKKRLISECVYINLNPTSINDRQDKDNISSAYCNIFRIIQRKTTLKLPHCRPLSFSL